MLSKSKADPSLRFTFVLPESELARLKAAGPDKWSDGRKIREAIADWLDRHERTR